MKHLMILILASALVGLQAQARTIRATDLIQRGFSDLSEVEDGTTVEFRQGDELPVTLQADGDLLETTRPGTTFIGVKRNFWVQVRKNDLLLSLDGVNYKKVQDLLTGSISAGAGSAQSGGVADSLFVKFTALLK